MHVYLSMLGCRLNEAELESWSRGFRAAGHRVVDRPDEAEVMVLNTCAVTGEAARKSRKLVSGLHRRNPSANLVVTGCFAELEPARVAALAGVDMVVGNRDKESLVARIGDRFASPSMPRLATEPDGSHVFGLAPEVGSPADRSKTTSAETASAETASCETASCETIVPQAALGGNSSAAGLVQLGRRSPPGIPAPAASGRTRAFIKVQDGCRNRCTFCIVTIARGEERSRSIDEVVAEIDALHAAGYQEAVLTGVHLGGYGRDLGTDLSALVRAVLARTSIPRVRLSSLEPWDLPPGFFQLWRDPRLMPHLHLPLQSGSDTVLVRMARRCSTGEFARLVADARAAIPDLSVTTDIIVGFPGESERDWRDTVAFVRSVGFAHMHIFSFSAREGTKAARLPNPIANADKRTRSRELHALAAAMKRAHLDRFVDSTRAVLWEGEGTELADGERRYVGYTDNYLRIETTSSRPLGNRITQARVTGVEARGGTVGHCLTAQPVS